ncbi:hypothetical protein ACFE04_008147 [Oxalis oulophora]
MDSNFKSSPSEAHPETMDFLSRAWCNFAVQTIQPDQLQDRGTRPIVLLDNSIKKFDGDHHIKSSFVKMDKLKIDDGDFKSIPPWKSNDVKSWIWMQQAMHPELNYDSCFKKKLFSWDMFSFKRTSIKKWVKDIKQKRKEEERLQRAQVHAAISVAGVAAALAAIAAENSKKDDSKETAMASAAALVAAQCAQVAEAMGAKREHVSSMMGSAMSSTNASDILTLTAAATTSLKGAATLKARTVCKNKFNSTAPELPLEDKNEFSFNFEKYKSVLAKGAQFGVETPDGDYTVRSVSVTINRDAKIILKLRKLNLFKSKKECIVMNLHAELYKDPEADQETYGTCYLVVLTTNRGTIKLDMGDDYQRYRTWATTINHMLMMSSSFTNYELQFYKN